MQKLWLTVLLVFAGRVCAQADPIALWNFNDAIPNSTGGLNEFTVDRGAGAMNSDFALANIGNLAGTTINSQDGDPSGRALALQAGAVAVNNGRYLTWFASTADFSSINVSFASQRTSTGFTNNRFQYSLNSGASWVDFGVPYSPATTFSLHVFDLSVITALNDNAGAGFRIVFDGATSSSGNNRIDNLLVFGTPLPATSIPVPSTAGLMAIGLAAMARERWARSRRFRR